MSDEQQHSVQDYHLVVGLLLLQVLFKLHIMAERDPGHDPKLYKCLIDYIIGSLYCLVSHLAVANHEGQ